MNVVRRWNFGGLQPGVTKGMWKTEVMGNLSTEVRRLLMNIVPSYTIDMKIYKAQTIKEKGVVRG